MLTAPAVPRAATRSLRSPPPGTRPARAPAAAPGPSPWRWSRRRGRSRAPSTPPAQAPPTAAALTASRWPSALTGSAVRARGVGAPAPAPAVNSSKYVTCITSTVSHNLVAQDMLFFINLNFILFYFLLIYINFIYLGIPVNCRQHLYRIACSILSCFILQLIIVTVASCTTPRNNLLADGALYKYL